MSEMGDAADEAAQRPSIVSSGKMDRVDMALSATGVALALFGAFFPWYVFFNHDKFAPNYGDLVQHMKRDLPILSPRSVFSVSPAASININKRPPDLAIPKTAALDDITTATVPEDNPDRQKAGLESAALDQPLPPSNSGNFRLLHVAGGRALIEDSSGMYMVGVGGTLPDNSTLQSIELANGRWMVKTSSGAMLEVK